MWREGVFVFAPRSMFILGNLSFSKTSDREMLCGASLKADRTVEPQIAFCIAKSHFICPFDPREGKRGS